MEENSVPNPGNQSVGQMSISSPNGGINLSSRLQSPHTISSQATHLLGHDYVAANGSFSTAGVSRDVAAEATSAAGATARPSAMIRGAGGSTSSDNRHQTPVQQSNHLPNGNVLGTSNHQHTMQQLPPASPQQLQNLQQMHHHHQLQQQMAFQQQHHHLDLAIHLQAAQHHIALQQLQAQQMQQYQQPHVQVQQQGLGLPRLPQMPPGYPGSVTPFVAPIEHHGPPQLSHDVLQGLDVTDPIMPEETKPELGESSVVDKMDNSKSTMTWLKAAEQILSGTSRPMHIKEIKQHILSRGLIRSNARSSLEATLYRDAQKPNARFCIVEGHFGMFRLMTPEEIHLRSLQRSIAKPTQHTQPVESENERYCKRFHKLRKVAKSMIFENASLCDETCRTEEKLIRVMEERKLLLKRVLQHQAVRQASALNATQMGSAFYKNTSPGLMPNSRFQDSGKRDGKMKNRNKHKKAREKSKQHKHFKDKKTESRSRTKKSNASRKFVQPITLDSTGRPVFPIVLGDLTVHSLGDVVSDRPGFHSEKYIFPVGFCSSRTFVSVKDPDKMCLYTCKILDDLSGPKFVIVSEDYPSVSFEASSASLAHAALLKSINSVCDREVVSHSKGSGPAFFGFSKPTIQNLIQSSPGPRKCARYKWMKFDICKQDERALAIDQSKRDPAINFQAFQNARTRNMNNDANLRNLLTEFHPTVTLTSRLTEPDVSVTS